VFRDVATYLKYFQGVRRRTIRDVATLPLEAETWQPPYGDGEGGWGIPKIVEHIAEAPFFFSSADRGLGWVWESSPERLSSRETWIPALERSADRFAAELADSPPEWLDRRVEAIADPTVSLAGWRALMMPIEHEIAHRAQLTTYAGVNGWPVHQIFDRTNEFVVGQREAEMKKRS
jgi:uncharacterized damage-inducible protein DinB